MNLRKTPIAIVAMGLVALLGVAATLLRNPSIEKVEITEQDLRFIKRALFFDDRLWMLSDDGELVALKPTGAEPESVSVPDKAFDICISGKHLVIATMGQNGSTWNFYRQSQAEWLPYDSIPTSDDKVIAINCDDDRIVLLTNRRLIKFGDIKFGDQAPTIQPLSQRIEPPFAAATVLGTETHLWVGFNSGEWGGGLKRISLRNGSVETIESNISGETCGGPLNSSCDPVNGIVASPWRSGCIVAAIGLVHFSPHGRIIEICDKNLRRLYFKPFEMDSFDNTKLDDGEPWSTVAFFGLARVGETLWSTGINGLYRFSNDRRPSFQDFPKFENRDGYRVSFEIPGIVLVLSDLNRRVSVMGAVPIIVKR